ncbi:MAG: hypothetical protein O3A51_11250 [Verrucomicrobia bacterium]|nr:hypothetical protein [Verrucomicrobiota bacterium]
MRIVTWRAIGISCALIPALSMWVVQAELIWYTGHSTAISLFFHVTTVLFLIALLNLWVRKRWPARALDGGELLTIYVMLSVAGTLCSHDMLQVLIPMLSHVTHGADLQNRWGDLILPHLPSWAIVTDKSAAAGLAVGNASLYRREVLMAWAKPIAFWSVVILTIMAAFSFMMAIFRQAWTEKERLSYPVIQIPIIISTRLEALLRNRLFWIAFAIAASIDILNGLNFLFPSVPHIPIVEVFSFREYCVERPWTAIAWTSISLYPFVIGLAFFLPTDLAFSCWFFFVLYQIQNVIVSALGIEELPGFPFPTEQAGGAYLAIGLLSIWLARRHLADAWRTAVGGADPLDETREPMRYRTAVFGFFACWVILIVCGTALGGSPVAMTVFFLIFFLYGLAIARMRAELGPPAHDLHAMGPEVLINNAVGTSHVGTGNLATFSLFFGFNRAYRAHYAAHAAEALKLAQVSRLTARSMMGAMAISLVVGFFSSVWALLHALYVHGYSGRPAGNAFSTQAWSRMESWLNFPKPAQTAATIAAAVGLVFTLFLGAMRTRFTWWLWHPVGFATSSSWSMSKLWACIFVAWVAKSLITRYGGARAYQTAIPFFVGLVIGEFLVGSFWGILGAALRMPVYHFWG